MDIISGNLMVYISNILNSYPPLVRSLMVSAFIVILLIFVGVLTNAFAGILMRFFSGFLGLTVGYFLINYVTFPGTILHELSHAFVALILGAKVKRIVFFEKPGSGRLGHVDYIPSSHLLLKLLQMALISCAPVAGNLIAFLISLSLLLSAVELPFKALFSYLCVSFIIHAGMSDTDIKAYLKGQLVAFPLLVLIISLMFGFMGF